MHKPLVSSPLSGWSSATTPDEEPTGSFQVPTSPGQIGPPRANENVNNEARTRPRRRRKVPTSEAEKELAHSKKMRAKWDKQVFEWQIKLFEPKVESKILSEAAKYLTPKDYEDVIIERISEKLCGYPLCDRPVTQTKGRFHVSRKEQKVVDLSEQKQFCSKSCFAASGFLKAQLLDEPVFMRNLDRLPAVELLPPGCPISEIQEARLKPVSSATPSTDLLSTYVSNLLQSLPKPKDLQVTIHEKPLTPTSTPDHLLDDSTLVTDHTAVEGYHIQYRKGKKKTSKDGQSSTIILPKADLKGKQVASCTVPNNSDDIQGASRGEVKEGVKEEEKQEVAPRRRRKNPQGVFSSSQIVESPPPPRDDYEPHKATKVRFDLSSSSSNSQSDSTSTIVEVLPPTPSEDTKPRPDHDSPQSVSHDTSISNLEADEDISAGPLLKPRFPPKAALTLSLFGQLFTILGRMITDRTKCFVWGQECPEWMVATNGGDSRLAAQKNIFVEQMDKTYALVRRDVKITTQVRDDYLKFLDTLALSETLVVRTPVEQWALTCIFLKVLCRQISELANEIDRQEVWERMIEPTGLSFGEFSILLDLF